jgi:hypothetical protein
MVGHDAMPMPWSDKMLRLLSVAAQRNGLLAMKAIASERSIGWCGGGTSVTRASQSKGCSCNGIAARILGIA